jgi:hypothetical protein
VWHGATGGTTVGPPLVGKSNCIRVGCEPSCALGMWYRATNLGGVESYMPAKTASHIPLQEMHPSAAIKREFVTRDGCEAGLFMPGPPPYIAKHTKSPTSRDQARAGLAVASKQRGADLAAPRIVAAPARPAPASEASNTFMSAASATKACVAANNKGNGRNGRRGRKQVA